ncbi:MAG: hypothetical protein IT493_15850 [Gammaproteobacteria bacterium]|nr:hypothetical protein [Gammaproteobacteria bacterium]
MTDSRLDRETRTQWLLDYLMQAGEATAQQVATQMGWTHGHAHVVLSELEAAGKVSRQRRGPTFFGQGRRPTLFRVRHD